MILTRALLHSTFTAMAAPKKQLWSAEYFPKYDCWALYNNDWQFHIWCSKWCRDEEAAQKKVAALNRIYGDPLLSP